MNRRSFIKGLLTLPLLKVLPLPKKNVPISLFRKPNGLIPFSSDSTMSVPIGMENVGIYDNLPEINTIFNQPSLLQILKARGKISGPKNGSYLP